MYFLCVGETNQKVGIASMHDDDMCGNLPNDDVAVHFYILYLC